MRCQSCKRSSNYLVAGWCGDCQFGSEGEQGAHLRKEITRVKVQWSCVHILDVNPACRLCGEVVEEGEH